MEMPKLIWTIITLLLFALEVLAAACWRDTICTGPTEAAFPGPWDQSIYAPRNRTVRPRSVFTLRDRRPASYPRTATLRGNGTTVVFDFGYEVGGIATLTYTSNGTGTIGIAFSEALNWVGYTSDSSNGKFSPGGGDGALYFNISTTGPGSYTMPDEVLRGGFKYMTVLLLTDTGTHVTNAVSPNTGRWVPMLEKGWANNGTLGPGSSILVDGAKRDQAVWPGDMGIAESVRNALQVMFDYQNADGSLPESGPPLLQQKSDTYHMWTLVGTYNYMLYTEDADFVLKNWPKYLKAIDYIYAKVDSSGLLIQTGTRDWGRWSTGFNNTAANILLFHTLQTSALLATWLNDTTSLASTWRTRATSLQSALLTHSFDPSHGAFRDNATNTSLYPQDANSLALLFSLIPPTFPTASSISAALTQNWTPLGAQPPELPAHFRSGCADRGLDLIRRSWGWYAKHLNGLRRGYENDASYVSHSHGWSAGPTSAMTEWVAGMRVTEPRGRRWEVQPGFGDLKRAEAGFRTGSGKFRVGWERGEGGYSLVIETPVGTRGWVRLPDPVIVHKL
ncbi:glycoside hydrolase family 78 protein [Bipolaris oryzae ATCC 44560]|uniref:Glycoside hydrolase family 78 protein n=1 Tax=Bipolaris oryzae ATCC 44560 TaxID=930090 RepID=W6ZKX8_COCMI|nr:glycoside hydrolase family 78 protein [Bipolaris oryzae ATCC 44560]EUC50658.1 glycoside hydrolase family 78 protein [Bipolaris oryzae ATCC 44560]